MLFEEIIFRGASAHFRAVASLLSFPQPVVLAATFQFQVWYNFDLFHLRTLMHNSFIH
jgi:hypothetical protein